MESLLEMLLDRDLQRMLVSVVACPRNQIKTKTLNQFKRLTEGFFVCQKSLKRAKISFC